MTTTAPLLTILELPQGRYSNLTGMKLADALAMFHEDSARFLREFPHCAKFHRPNWHISHREQGARAPIGYEYYLAADDGTLSVYEFNHDSSD